MPFAGSDQIRIYPAMTQDSGQKCRVRQLEPARGASKPRPRSDVETVGKLGRVNIKNEQNWTFWIGVIILSFYNI